MGASADRTVSAACRRPWPQIQWIACKNGPLAADWAALLRSWQGEAYDAERLANVLWAAWWCAGEVKRGAPLEALGWGLLRAALEREFEAIPGLSGLAAEIDDEGFRTFIVVACGHAEEGDPRWQRVVAAIEEADRIATNILVFILGVAVSYDRSVGEAMSRSPLAPMLVRRLGGTFPQLPIWLAPGRRPRLACVLPMPCTQVRRRPRERRTRTSRGPPSDEDELADADRPASEEVGG